MHIEPGETRLGKIITFTGAEETNAVQIGILMLCHFVDEAVAEMGAYTALVEFGGQRLRPNRETFTLSTDHFHERQIIDGLGWVVRNKERLAAEAFAEDSEKNGVQSAFEKMHEVNFEGLMEDLVTVVDELDSAGLIDVTLELDRPI